MKGWAEVKYGDGSALAFVIETPCHIAFDSLGFKYMMGDAQSRVLTEVVFERAKQDRKWGEQNHKPCEWMTVLGEEFGEACQEALRVRFGENSLGMTDYTALREELIQCAAVAVAIIECIDRQMQRSDHATG